MLGLFIGLLMLELINNYKKEFKNVWEAVKNLVILALETKGIFMKIIKLFVF